MKLKPKNRKVGR